MAETDRGFNRETKYCSICGEPLEPGSNFCGGCGAEATATGASAQGIGQGKAGPDGVEYVGFGVRLAAAVIDGVITGVAGAILNAITGIPAIGSLTSVVYYVLFTGLKGQTPGKMALGIQVVDAQGNPPGIMRAILRELPGKLISTLAIFLGFFWIIWDRRKRGWHDYIAGTFVVRKKRP